MRLTYDIRNSIRNTLLKDEKEKLDKELEEIEKDFAKWYLNTLPLSIREIYESQNQSYLSLGYSFGLYSDKGEYGHLNTKKGYPKNNIYLKLIAENDIVNRIATYNNNKKLFDIASSKLYSALDKFSSLNSLKESFPEAYEVGLKIKESKSAKVVTVNKTEVQKEIITLDKILKTK